MCGLTGGLWRDARRVAPEVAAAALESIAHRGPDAKGHHFESGLFLGHRRLSIIDLDSRSTQPMHAGPLSIVFNGEIYNYRELRSALQRRGWIFQTESDTEVLLAAFTFDGIDCLPYLEGMFAFAIWDRKARRLTLARDRYGEKPLVYFDDGSQFLFASEVPAIEALAGGELEIDRSNLALFFRFSYLPAPFGPFKGMKQLRPGHWLQFDPTRWSIHEGNFYSIKASGKQETFQGSFDDAKVELRQRLTASVRHRLAASDVPVATFLSGGLDSSIVAALSVQEVGSRIACYSVAFPNDPAFDESPYAKSLAARYPQIDHRVLDVTEDRLADFTDRTLSLLGEPFADASLIPTAFLCSRVDEKVILGGDGADELFAGYGTYASMRMSARVPPWIRAGLQALPQHENPAAIRNPLLRAAAFFRFHMKPNAVGEYLSWRTYASLEQIQELGFSQADASLVPEDIADAKLTTLRDILTTDIKFNLPADMLKKVDLASMQHGLEVRLPFLDSELVAFALSLPEGFLISGGARKHVLREAFRDELPEDILRRGKKGFLLPIRQWMKTGRMRDELSDIANVQTLLDPHTIKGWINRHESGRQDLSQVLWSCYVFLKWMSSRQRLFQKSNLQAAAIA